MVVVKESRSVAEHLASILAVLAPLEPQSVPLARARGAMLRTDVVAPVDVPGFATSAMDGYAVRSPDVASATPSTPAILTVVAEVPAGSHEDPPLAPGHVARIMTGAPVPTAADAIVPVEDTDDGRTTVEIYRAVTAGTFVRRAGSDAAAGARVLTAPRRLTSRDLAAAAAVGMTQLVVQPAPRVGILSTGDELAAPGQVLARGEIHDANSVLLAGLVADAGGVPVVIAPVGDDEHRFAAVLDEYDGTLDLIITSGGVSVGDHDVVKAVLAPQSGVWFGPVRMQPGKPQGFGTLPGGTVIFTLPGNPVSVFVSFETFVRPAIRALRGESSADLVRDRAVVAQGWSSPLDRMQLMPVRFDDAGSIAPATAGGAASHLIASLSLADGLAIVDESVHEVSPGTVLDVIRLDPDVSLPSIVDLPE